MIRCVNKSKCEKEEKVAVKDNIIEYLELNRGSYISGEQLATKLSISRTAIWKAIKRLQEEGYNIEAATNKGYRLAENTDVLSVGGVEKYLKAKGVRLEILKSVDSTNEAIKLRVNEDEGLVVAALEQTAGKGRLGRSFYSPNDTGIYFSILLKPDIATEDITLLTAIAALSVCEAIEKCTDKQPSIKWVNDVFVDGKKVSGTLTQASFSIEDFGVEYVIVGIGINVYSPENGFLEDLKDIAGALCEHKNGNLKNRILAEILNSFFCYYRNFDSREYIQKYRDRSFLIGKNINVISTKNISSHTENTNAKPAVAIAIDDSCRLVVRYEDGKEEALSTGEVSIRI